MKRRECIGMTAASAEAGIIQATFPIAARAQTVGSYVPITNNYMAAHNNAIVIDGAVPLLAGTFNPKHIDWWIQGVTTAISVTAGGGNLGPDKTAQVIAWVAEQIETRPELMLCRTGNDIRTAKREGRLPTTREIRMPTEFRNVSMGVSAFWVRGWWRRAPDNSRDQYTVEAFYRFDATDFLQITPEVQYVVNPANDATTDDILVLGLRLRMAF